MHPLTTVCQIPGFLFFLFQRLLTCLLSLCEEEEEEALLCVGVELLWTGVALLSSILAARP